MISKIREIVRDTLNARRYRTALETIRRDYGRVCSGYEICSPDECIAAVFRHTDANGMSHPDCEPWRGNESSVGAWFVADAALGRRPRV